MHHFFRLGDCHTVIAKQFFDRESHNDATAVTDGVFRVLDDFTKESYTIFQRPAVFVSALIAATLKKVHRETQVVASVNVDEIEAGGPSANGRLTMPATILADVVLRHRPRLMRIAVLEWLMRWCQRDFSRVQIGRCRPVVSELHRRQRTVCMHAIAHQRECGNVSVVPQSRLDIRRDIAAGMDLAFFSRHHRPSTFCLRFAHRGVRGRHLVSHPIAVRYLKEPVPRRNGTDFHRFEENVVAWIACSHGVERSVWCAIRV